MADNKTKPTKISVSAFIDAITDEGRRADAKALVKLMQKAAGEKQRCGDLPSLVSAATTMCMTAGEKATCR
jgi:hypothetical protein